MTDVTDHHRLVFRKGCRQPRLEGTCLIGSERIRKDRRQVLRWWLFQEAAGLLVRPQELLDLMP